MCGAKHQKNPGYNTWLAVRKEWTTPTAHGKVRGARNAMDRDFLDEIDEEQVIECLQKYRRFPAPVPLAAMVEVLTVIWEDESSL